MGDFFRSPPGRYLGYAHVVGGVVPGVSPATRVWMTRATQGYVVFDVISKAMDRRSPNAVVKAVDAALWQGLATLLLPSLLAQGAAQVSSLAVASLKLHGAAARVAPLASVVLLLAVLGRPIDAAVDSVLDHTTRPLLF